MRFTRLEILVPLVAASLTAVGCASSSTASAERPAVRANPVHAQNFERRVDTLASASYGGRAPGTPGIERAARFIERELAATGIEPFTVGGNADWRLPFEVAGELKVERAVFAYEAPGASGELRMEEQFNPLGISGEGAGEGTLAFVGYGIEDGPDGYSSFGATDDLSGKIVILMRFEPLDEEGRSRWSQRDEGWSNAAGLRAKFDAVLEREPAGVVFISPPGVDDPRADTLPTARSTRFGERADVPIVAATTESVARLVRLADHEGRSLMELRRLADAGEAGVIDLSAGRVRLDVSMTVDQIETDNVAGVLPGQGELADEWVVIGAHYDHLGMGQVGTSRAPQDVGKKIHFGADDNASGVAGVLQAAEELSDLYAALPPERDARSILFLFFSAEEMGLLGSRDFVEQARLDPEDMTVMLNLDMIGRLRDNTLTVNGVGTAAEFDDLLPGYWERFAFDVETTAGGLGPSDHASFYRGGIPVLAFFTGLHEDYHTPADTPDKINADGGARIASLVANLAYGVAVEPGRLSYVETRSQRRENMPRTRSRVRLGFMPGSYDETERGVLVGEVLEDSPAEEAGLREGDRIVRWNGEELANIFSYMQALGGHEPGDRVSLAVERDGREVELTATLGSSDRTR
jgi:hypothetical protein